MSYVFFTDRNLGKQFPAILAAAGLTVERHHDLFAPAGPALAHAFVASLPKIEQFLGAHTAPFIAKVYRTADAQGSVELWYPK